MVTAYGSSLKNQSSMRKIRALAWKGFGIALAIAMLLLSAPFVSLTPHEDIPPPAPAVPAPVESRVAVRFRHGDTLIAVLKRFGIERPSAHALIEKMRPFVNPRKFNRVMTFMLC